MAIIAGTVKRAYNFSSPGGDQEPVSVSSVPTELMQCFLDVVYDVGTYAQANDATITAATVIQNSLRDGKTVTVLGCTCVGVGHAYLTATTVYDIGGGLPSTITSGVVTHPLTLDDYTTELTNGLDMTTITWETPVRYCVTFRRNLD